MLWVFLVWELTTKLLVLTFTTMKELQRLRSKTILAEDNTLSQIHHNFTLRKGKAIALNSAEIKIVRTNAKTPFREFSIRLSVAWLNYFFNMWRGIIRNRRTVKDWFQQVFPWGYQLLDRTTSSMCDVELSATDRWSQIGSSTLPNSDGPCSSIGEWTDDTESSGELIR